MWPARLVIDTCPTKLAKTVSTRNNVHPNFGPIFGKLSYLLFILCLSLYILSYSGKAGFSQVLRAHPNTDSLRGPWQRYTDDPIRAPNVSARPMIIPIRPQCRSTDSDTVRHTSWHSPGVRREGKQLERVRAEFMAVAVWARQASRGGSVCR
jgi:hypothetical protein